MATLVSDIKTNNWQLSTVGVGYIAEGLADIRQCIDTILRTSKHSVPLQPEFGCDIYQYVDQPLTIAIANIKKAIIEAIEIWEKRVVLKSVVHELVESNPGQVRFFITVQLTDSELEDIILLYLRGGVIDVITDTTAIVLFGFYIPNPNNKRYQISLIADGAAVLPLPPSDGFGTLLQIFTWVTANWGFAGKWIMNPDRLILYVNPGFLQTGSITISLLGNNRFFQLIPKLDLGEKLSLTFLADLIPGSPVPPATFDTRGDMLLWVQNNWPQYGQWSIQTVPAVNGDFDLSDFDLSDFDTGTEAYYLLVLVSETVEEATINISAV